MNIRGFLRELPSPFLPFLPRMGILGETAIKIRDYCRQTTLWQQIGKPWYERNVQPLNTIDALFLGSGFVFATVITFIALKTLGIATIALVLVVDALLIIGGYSFSRYRIREHFNAIAWDHVDQMRRTANAISYNNQLFNQISHQRGLLQKPEFQHLEQDLKQLDDEIHKFRNVALAPYYEDKRTIVLAHLTVLKGIVQGHAQDTALVEALEQDIQKVGKEEQNLQTLETHKQKLLELQTADARLHIVELRKQIHTLIKTVQAPHFTDSKLAFMEYLKGFQNKLACYRLIEDLPAHHPIQINAFDQPPVNNPP